MLEAMLDAHSEPPPDDLPDNIRGLLGAEFERLVELGVFHDVRVELLEGQLVEMSPQGAAHATITSVLADLLHRGLPETMIIRQHSSLRASDRSMPEPDIAVIPRVRGFHHPSEAFLIVEVSDSSLRNDREIKSRIYARANILEYWIIDVKHEQVEVRTEPGRKGYASTRVLGRGELLRPNALPELSLAVDAIFDC